MKKCLFLLILLCIGKAMQAQYVYTIKADSVKITNSCDTAELIIENHTQTVPGFLFNKGKGRTEFRKPAVLNDSALLFGFDTLVIRGATTASNGLSMIGKDVRLGQVIGAAGNPAALHNHREIPLNGFNTVFTGSGNVGIGTSAPYTKLHVTGNILSDANFGFISQGTLSYNALNLQYGNNDNAGGVSRPSVDGGELRIYSNPSGVGTGNGYMTFFTRYNERLRIHDNGNVGINTVTDDGYKLDVNGTSNVRGHAYFPGGVAETLFDQINSLGGVSVYGTFARGTGLHMNFDGTTGLIRAYNAGTGQPYPVQLCGVATISQQIDNVSANLLVVAPFLDQQRLGTPIVRGIFYSPSVANLDNTKHIAFGNTVGDNKLNISSGNTGIGLDETTLTTSKLDVNGSNGYNQLRLRQSYTPTSSSDTNGKVGDVSWDDNYFYIKTSNGWKRSALSTF